jgi:cysteine desulfurase
VAARFGARPREVVFVSSGTEAVNSAIWGIVGHLEHGHGGHVVTSAVEHSSVLDSLARSDVETTSIGVDAMGRFDPDDVLDAVRDDTVLVSVQLANHEVGTVQPVDKVCALLSDRRDVLVHVDACAAAGYMPVDFRASGADLCSLTSHKFGGPVGAGALLVRRGLRIDPMLVGGAQERARRGGRENVAAWIGFGAASEALDVEREARAERALIDVARRVIDLVPGVVRYGDPAAGGSLPNLLCLGVEGVEAEPILLGLDQHGVAVHSGSSCSSETLEPSPVLAAMGVDAEHSLRVSVGWCSGQADVERFVEVFPGIVERLRGLRTP